MPYIKDREFLDDVIDKIDFGELVAGDLAYMITRLLIGFTETTISYKNYALAIGVLETVKEEFYKREITPYEEEKCEMNGDVYGRQKEVRESE